MAVMSSSVLQFVEDIGKHEKYSNTGKNDWRAWENVLQQQTLGAQSVYPIKIEEWPAYRVYIPFVKANEAQKRFKI